MKTSLQYSLVAATLISVTAGMVYGTDYTWRGVNTADLSSYFGGVAYPLQPYMWANMSQATTNAVDYYDLWSPVGVPGPGDTADFYWSSTDTSVWGGDDETAGEAPVVISNGFQVAHLIIRSGAWNTPSRGTDAQLELRQDLTIEDIHMQFGYSSASQGENNLEITDGFTLTLTGANPVSFAAQRAGWGGFIIGNGSALRFNGPYQTLDSFNYGTYTKGNGRIEFAYTNGTIELGDPGSSGYANIQMGTGNDLWLHPSVVVTNPTGTGFIRINTGANKTMVHSIDGNALTNAGGLALRFERGTVNNYDVFVPQGTYQGIEFYNDLHYSRTIDVMLTGDVKLTGGAVIPSDPAVESDYGLYLHNSRAMRTRFYTDGNDLTTTKGVWIRAVNPNAAYNAYSMFYVNSGSSVDIGGDLTIESNGYLPGNTNTTGVLDETRNVGMTVAAGETVVLRGDYSTNVRSRDANNLNLATLCLIGGTAVSNNTFEVAADQNDDVASGTYGIATLNVGTNSEAALIRLVNEFLNDNDPANTNKVKEGEVLLVGNLTIGEGSTLDCDSQGVKVTTALAIAATGTLDLNTGLALVGTDIINSFFGVGDQTAQWSAVASRVIDSGNSGFTFIPVYDADADRTYWKASGGSTVLIIR